MIYSLLVSSFAAIDHPGFVQLDARQQGIFSENWVAALRDKKSGAS